MEPANTTPQTHKSSVIPDAPDCPPYVFVAINKDRHESHNYEVHRTFVLLTYPTKIELEQLQESIDEDRSIIDETEIVEAVPDFIAEHYQKIASVYARLLN